MLILPSDFNFYRNFFSFSDLYFYGIGLLYFSAVLLHLVLRYGLSGARLNLAGSGRIIESFGLSKVHYWDLFFQAHFPCTDTYSYSFEYWTTTQRLFN